MKRTITIAAAAMLALGTSWSASAALSATQTSTATTQSSSAEMQTSTVGMQSSSAEMQTYPTEQRVSAASAAPSAKADKGKKKVETVTFQTNIHCKNCANKIKDNVAFEKGVKDLEVSVEDKTVKLSYDPAKTSPEKLAKAIEKLGYTVTIKQ